MNEKVIGVLFFVNTKKNIFSNIHISILDEITIHIYSAIIRISATLEKEKALIKLKNAQEIVIQSEKMAAIGTLAAGIAHEINNPIAYVKSNIGIMIENIEKIVEFFESINSDSLVSVQDVKKIIDKNNIKFILDDICELLPETADGVLRIINIVSNLKDFSRVELSAKTPAKINDILENSIKMLWNKIKYKAKIEKKFSLLPDFICYPQKLSQVFLNLISNSLDAIEDCNKNGLISIFTSCDADSIIIKICDNGSGIDESIMNRIFEPFFTTKPQGKGTGLGLSICYDIIKDHSGSLILESNKNKGTTAIITFPLKFNYII